MTYCVLFSDQTLNDIFNSPKAFGEFKTLLSPPPSPSPHHSNFYSFFLFFLPLFSHLHNFAMTSIDSTWPKLALTCPNLSKLAQTCPNLPKLAQTCPNLAWLSLALVISLSQCTRACWEFALESLELPFILSGFCSPSEANYCSNPFEFD